MSLPHTTIPANVTPFVDLDYHHWDTAADAHDHPLSSSDLQRLSSLGDALDLHEVETIYRPLSKLLGLYVTAARQLHRTTANFFVQNTSWTPFVIGIAGSVAVGKSTTARIFQELLSRNHDTPEVQLVTTDGFLYPNAVLEERGLMRRKGFPESYDRRRLLRFLSAVKSGAAEVSAPSYSHVTYDIVPGEEIVVRRPDILILEGLNVLAPARLHPSGRTGLAVSDFFDFSIYVDAKTTSIKQWYVDRFLALRRSAFTLPESHFRRYASLPDDEAIQLANTIWETINEPNLIHNVLPTRGRARLVLTKGPQHSIHRIRLRKT